MSDHDNTERGWRVWRARIQTIVKTGALVGGVLFLCLFLGLAAVFYTQNAPLQSAKIVTVPKGATLSQIANALEKQNLISNAFIFKLGVRLHAKAQNLRAGEYEFSAPTSSSMYNIMTLLAEGKTLLHALTIPEGLTSAQIIDLLKDNPLLNGTFTHPVAEGRWLPETYKIRRGITRDAFASRMTDAMDDVVAHLWATRHPHPALKTPQEAVILASIVEKETGLEKERGLVASVFLNRLQKKMRLQSDPTIIYGLVGGRGRLGHPIRLSELRKPTPYNTYIIDALPPTPISNPGRASLAAVMHASPSPYLYFVAEGAGGHIFSQTLAEHNENVKKWRKIKPQKKGAK